MQKVLTMLCVMVLAGCGLSIENEASSDGYSTARQHIGDGGCSMQAMEHELWSLRVHGFSKEYIAWFASSYKRTCDEHLRRMEHSHDARDSLPRVDETGSEAILTKGPAKSDSRRSFSSRW